MEVRRMIHNSNNEGEVYFGLFGDDFDPDEVTALVGIEPTKTARKGNPIPKQASWILSTGMIEDDVIDVYEMSSEIIEKLEPLKNQIIEVMKKYELEAVLEVVLKVTSDDSKSTPAIGFEANVIKFLSDVDAFIDVDTYRK
jgi:hypothetical protein